MSVNFTVRVPRKLYERMKKFREINWSEVVRRAIEDYLRRLEYHVEESIEDLKEKIDSRLLRELEFTNIEEDVKYYEEMVKREWKRMSSMTQTC